jgi:hypothetical protein
MALVDDILKGFDGGITGIAVGIGTALVTLMQLLCTSYSLPPVRLSITGACQVCRWEVGEG